MEGEEKGLKMRRHQERSAQGFFVQICAICGLTFGVFRKEINRGNHLLVWCLKWQQLSLGIYGFWSRWGRIWLCSAPPDDMWYNLWLSFFPRSWTEIKTREDIHGLLRETNVSSSRAQQPRRRSHVLNGLFRDHVCCGHIKLLLIAYNVICYI